MFEYVTIRGRAYRKVNLELWYSFYCSYNLLDSVTNPMIFRYKNLAYLFRNIKINSDV
jgi:hypothetical protein